MRNCEKIALHPYAKVIFLQFLFLYLKISILIFSGYEFDRIICYSLYGKDTGFFA